MLRAYRRLMGAVWTAQLRYRGRDSRCEGQARDRAKGHMQKGCPSPSLGSDRLEEALALVTVRGTMEGQFLAWLAGGQHCGRLRWKEASPWHEEAREATLGRPGELGEGGCPIRALTAGVCTRNPRRGSPGPRRKGLALMVCPQCPSPWCGVGRGGVFGAPGALSLEPKGGHKGWI